MDQSNAAAFRFLPFRLVGYANESADHYIKHEPPPTPPPVLPAAAGQSLGLPPEVQHPTDEDLLYAAMLLNDQPLEESLLDDGSMLHLGDVTSFSDAERERERAISRQVCGAAGCTLMCRPRGRLCNKHQKQRERGRTPFELKDPSAVLRQGRPPVPFSKSHRRKKLQRFDELVDQFAGGKAEGSMLLQAYMDSGLWRRRLAAHQADDCAHLFEFVGRALLSELPPTHPIRAQMNALFTEKQVKEATLASEMARRATTLPLPEEHEVLL